MHPNPNPTLSPLTFAVALAASFAGCGQQFEQLRSPDWGEPAPELAVEAPEVAVPEAAADPAAAAPVAFEAEREYVGATIAHHQEGVAIAAVARERGTHPELRELANRNMAARQVELARLRAWLAVPAVAASTTPLDLPATLSQPADALGVPGPASTALVNLARTEPFDLAWLDAMITHHEAAGASAAEASSTCTDPVVRALAAEVGRTHATELTELRRLRAEWYPSARRPAPVGPA
jgi:uncharacterized protein (DUF305 family)